MAQGITQWIEQNKTNDKSAEMRVLERAKRLEKKRLDDGWRYIKVSKSTEVFVPCDKDGNPTEDGLRRIRSITGEQ